MAADDLTGQLRLGCVYHAKRWSGDTHTDLGGSIDEDATDRLMIEAADKIEQLRAAVEAAMGWLVEDSPEWEMCARALYKDGA